MSPTNNIVAPVTDFELAAMAEKLAEIESDWFRKRMSIPGWHYVSEARWLIERIRSERNQEAS